MLENWSGTLLLITFFVFQFFSIFSVSLTYYICAFSSSFPSCFDSHLFISNALVFASSFSFQFLFPASSFTVINSTAQKYFENYPSINDDVGKFIQDQPLNFHCYHQEEMYARVDQFSDDSNHPPDTDKAYCRYILKSFN